MTSAVTAILAAGLFMVAGDTVFGQARGGTAKKSKHILRVNRRVNTLGARFVVETPQYNTDQSRGTADPKKWQKLEVAYETYPEWIDELVVQYYAMGVTRDKRTGKKVYSLYKLTVKYGDIEQGRNHRTSAFIRPAALKRYGDIFAVAVVFSVGGKVVEEVSQETERMPKQWWKVPAVINRPDVVVRSGYMVNRADSPWSLVNIDDYEVIK